MAFISCYGTVIAHILLEKEFFITGTPELLINPSVSAGRLVEIIKEQGPIVCKRLQELDALRNTMHFVMARMGLESINIQFIIQSDPDGHRKAVTAIKNLEKVAGELRKFDLTGLSVRVS